MVIEEENNESYEEALKASAKRLEAVEKLKETEKIIADMTERLGLSLEGMTKRLELKKIELTSLAEFMEKLNEKADELDELETDILVLLKKKLEK